jgi:hypothetical protein
MENKVLKNITSVYTDKSINGWVRGAIWIGTIAVVYFGGKAIYKKIFPSDEQKRSREQVRQAEEDLQNCTINKPLSYSITQFNQWADQLATAMSGCDYTSVVLNPFASASYKTTVDIFSRLKNDCDYLQLVKSYGIRTISKNWWCGGDYENNDLPTALGKQLSSEEINSKMIPKGVNKVLSDNGISYRITVI